MSAQTTEQIETRNCGICGEKFKPTLMRQIHCSARCKERVADAKAKAVMVMAMRATPCLFCGTSFKPERLSTRFCSRNCQRNHNTREAFKRQERGRDESRAAMALLARGCGNCRHGRASADAERGFVCELWAARSCLVDVREPKLWEAMP
jgi:hypothetical protein